MGRHASRIDENQPEIVNALRKIGASVQTLSAVGLGCPDLLVGYQGANYLIEVKNPARTAKRLLPDSVWQQPWHDSWRGQVAIATTPAEAFAIIGAKVS